MSAGGNAASTQRGETGRTKRTGAVALLVLGVLLGGVLTAVGGGPAGAAVRPATAVASDTGTLASEAAAARARLAVTSTQAHGTTLPVAHPAADGAHAPAGGGSASAATAKADATQTVQLGLDVSSYQGAVNWSSVAGSGATFAYVKATENTNYTNAYFSSQYSGSAAAGLLRGAYHYAIPSNSTGAAQADYFVANGGGWTADGMTLPGALDIESGTSESLPECYGLSQAAMVSWVGSFVTEYKDLTGRYPVIYTGYYFWQDCTGDSSAFSSTDPLWFPRYGATQAAPVAPGWSSYVIWQYADSGTFPGDQDQFAGSEAQLVAFANNSGAVSAVCVGTLGHESGGRPAVVGMAPTPDGGGYWVVDAAGGVAACGDAVFQGSPTTLAKPIVGIAAGPDDTGYYLVGSDGGIFTYGSATFHGSAGNVALTKPIVGMTTNAAGNGYWLVAADGGIFTYNVPFYGSAGNIALRKPIVGMAVDRATGGYWMVATDGGIFSYNAPFRGSAGNLPLVRPVVGMAVDRATNGYWLVAADGGVFSYDATFYGSAGNLHLVEPIVGMAAPPTGVGYWMVAADGGIFSYATPFEGSAT